MSAAIETIQYSDEKEWRPLWAGYLDFYEMSLPEAVTAATFARLVEDERFLGLAAKRDGALVGLAHAVFHPTTGSLGDRCYLQDLFVAPPARRAGVAGALLARVFEACRQRGCERVYWTTQKDNAPARALYDGLASRSDSVRYQVMFEV